MSDDSTTPNDQSGDSSGEQDTPQFSEEVLALQQDPSGIQKLLDTKRNANGEAKQHRQAAEGWEKKFNELQAKVQKDADEAERAKLTEQERLQKDLDQFQTDNQGLQGQLAEKDKAISTLNLHVAALRLGANDPELVEFKLGKHLSSLDDKARSEWNPESQATWLAELKENSPEFFGAQEKPPGNTFPKPPGKTPDQRKTPDRLPENLRNPKSHEDVKALDSRIKEIIRS